MRPLPDLSNADVLILRGKMSVLASSRNDAAATLRDATTAVQSAEWSELYVHASVAAAAAERLQKLAAMWQEVAA
jgi:hypothetical protein